MLRLDLDKKHVAGAVRLFQEGSTLPFIARLGLSMSHEQLDLKEVPKRADGIDERRGSASD